MDSWRVNRGNRLQGDACVDTNFGGWSVLCTVRVYNLSFSPSDTIIVRRMEMPPIRRLIRWVDRTL